MIEHRPSTLSCAQSGLQIVTDVTAGSRSVTRGLRTCASCKWVSGSGEFARCVAPQNDVGGRLGFGFAARWIFCQNHRTDNWLIARFLRTCGRPGRWWEPALPESP